MALNNDDNAHSLLADIERCDNDILSSYADRISGIQIGHIHFFLFGVARRTLAQSKAFRDCILDKNALVASALIRLQLDTVLRLYAMFWVSDAAKFAKAVFEGKQVNRLKAADGKQMSDKYLIDRLLLKNQWISDVYSNTSGLIHFSERHIMAALKMKNTVTGEAEVFIGPNNPCHSIGDFTELLQAFLHIEMMILVATQDLFSRYDYGPASNYPPIKDSDNKADAF